MAEAFDASKVSSNYYKIGHFHLVNYTVFGADKPGEEQTFLELELSIRKKFPRCLITYYNRTLFHFCFEHVKHSYELGKHFPVLKVVSSGQVSAHVLANPQTLRQETKDQEKEKYVPYIAVNFFKAIKKMALYNLSLSGVVELFGNYAVVDSPRYCKQIIHLEPVIRSDGNLFLFISLKSDLRLYSSNVVNFGNLYSQGVDFALYIIPSGIRCHLQDTKNYASNFTLVPPKLVEKITNLISMSTGMNKDFLIDTKWVKLVPNLQHLNNQTSQISKFIHNVENRKYIMWPWKLCLVQFGYCEELPRPPQGEGFDPFSLISEFMDFNISLQSTNTSFNAQPIAHTGGQQSSQSILSTGISSKSTVENMEQDGDPRIGSDAFLPSNEKEVTVPKPNFLNPELQEVGDGSYSVSNEDDIEMNDLFGDTSGEESYDEKVTTEDHKAKDIERTSIDNDENFPKKITANEDISDHVSDRGKDNPGSINSKFPFDETKTTRSDEASCAPSTYIEIPRDQMTVLNFSELKTTSPRTYRDPGAPLPLFPTPLVPQTTTFSADASGSQNVKQEMTEGNHVGETNKSVFSPLHFNPIIETNIDTKYGRGGKFYVSKEQTANNTDSLWNSQLLSKSGGSVPFSGKLGNTDSKMEAIDKVQDSFDPLKGTLEGDDNIPEVYRGQKVNSDNSNFEATLLKNDFPKNEPCIKNEDEVSLNSASHQDASGLKDMAERKSGSIQLGEHENKHHLRLEGDTKKMEDDELCEAEEDEEEDDDDDEDDNDEEESDEDEVVDDYELKNSPPLKLNISKENSGSFKALQDGADNDFMGKQQLNVFASAGNSSPATANNNLLKFPLSKRFESPLNSSSINSENLSPIGAYEQNQIQSDFKFSKSLIPQEVSIEPKSESTALDYSSSKGLQNEDYESSNCLPLILRTINVYTIPEMFLLNNLEKGESREVADFKMEEDDTDVLDLDFSQGKKMQVKLNHLNDLLFFLVTLLVFDNGLLDFKNKLKAKVPESFAVCERPHPAYDSESPNFAFESGLNTVFPYIYRVGLDELINTFENKDKDRSESVSEAELNFLEDISTDDALNPTSYQAQLNSIEWDSIYTRDPSNEVNFGKYEAIMKKYMHEANQKFCENENTVKLSSKKVRVTKCNSNILNLNSTGLRFWKYLRLSPIFGQKNFQVILITDSDPQGGHFNYDAEFLNALSQNYRECNFGRISLVNLKSSDMSSDLERIKDGILFFDKGDATLFYDDIYKQINRKLVSLVKMIKLDIMNKTNQFEFDQPLLLTFVDFDKHVNSVLQISKLIRNLKMYLGQHQLPLVEVFPSIIPLSFLFRQVGSKKRLRYLSNHKLTTLSMNLYNQCPNKPQIVDANAYPPKTLFTHIAPDPATGLHFKLNPNSNSQFGTNDDIFLHFAYKRSIDKKWFSASWSDPLGITTHIKTWYCAREAKNSLADLNEVSDEAWEISMNMFKCLHKELIQRTPRLGAKKFLVLTRVGGMIPDEELVQWKRVSVKQKDVSLIVLAVGNSPVLLQKDHHICEHLSNVSDAGECNNMGTSEFMDDTSSTSHAIPDRNSGQSNVEFFKAFPAYPPAASPQNAAYSAMGASPSTNAGASFNSPQQFIANASNFLSPQDSAATGGNLPPNSLEKSNELNLVLVDLTDAVSAIISSTPLPPRSAPTAMGMKAGYLVKEFKNFKGYTSFFSYEVSLLSCSNHWDLDALMRMLLLQYKSLITLNGILLTHDSYVTQQAENEDEVLSVDTNINSTAVSLIPWHVFAINKTIDYLVHIEVER